MLPFSHLICYCFCVSGGTTVLTTEKPTVIDSTIQSGIKYQRENVVDFTYACPFPQNSTSLRFSISVALKVLAEMSPASGPQAWAINTAFLSSTCICSREQHFLPHQSLPNGDNPRSQRKEPRNILCLNAAHLGHGLCLQTQEKEVSQAAAWLFIFIATQQIRDRRSLSVLSATELAVLQPHFQWVRHEMRCRKPGLAVHPERSALGKGTSASFY